MFGSWALDARAYSAAEPCRHLVIDGFFCDGVARDISLEVPDGEHPAWYSYRNSIEVKDAMDDLRECSAARDAVWAMSSPEFVQRLRDMTGIVDLDADPFMHGAGIHSMRAGGRLDVHLDYSVHPRSGKRRVLNLIVYLTPGWDPAWGGGLELWSGDGSGEPRRLAKRIDCLFNRCVLMECTDSSFHGVPVKIACPPEVRRTSLAVYYVSGLPFHGERRPKARFWPMPGAPLTPGLRRLYAIRAGRRLTSDDEAEAAAADSAAAAIS